MFFAHRAKHRFRAAFVACVAYAVLAAAVAAVLPRDGLGFLASFGWWLCVMPIGLAAWVTLELFGTWSLGLPFWQRMPSWARVVLLVVLISCCAVAVVFVNQLVGNHGPL